MKAGAFAVEDPQHVPFEGDGNGEITLTGKLIRDVAGIGAEVPDALRVSGRGNGPDDAVSIDDDDRVFDLVSIWALDAEGGNLHEPMGSQR